MKTAIITFVLALVIMAGVLAQQNPNCPAGSTHIGVDQWANSVVSTRGTIDSQDNALGVNDSLYAIIPSGNPNPYIVLDMGEGEEVWDKNANDFIIFGDITNELALVFVSQMPDTGFVLADIVNSDEKARINIDSTGYDWIRYVKIVNPTRRRQIEIDAVRGACITEPQANDVPEFSAAASVAVLGLIGLFVWKKRN
jgi:hypothetical protein